LLGRREKRFSRFRGLGLGLDLGLDSGLGVSKEEEISAGEGRGG